MTRFAILLFLAASMASSETLFDGRTFHHFRTPTSTTGPEVSWRIVDRVLESLPKAERQCDLWTDRQYENFDLEFDWKVEPGGNSGIKYLIQASNVDHLTTPQGHPYLHETSLGYEFQLVATDPEKTALTTGATGALYNYLAPTEIPAHQPGKWNTGRLVVDGRNVEHWVNGHRVLAFS
ncbi:MAG: DUF1080 domain-containing protein, partial [Acidobacteria bacterium]|nr:DUF1080 domain-containing protein [Acidobacteriota bacterium]